MKRLSELCGEIGQISRQPLLRTILASALVVTTAFGQRAPSEINGTAGATNAPAAATADGPNGGAPVNSGPNAEATAPAKPATASNSTSALHDPLQDWNKQLKEVTGDVLGFTFEERTRWEEKMGVTFGKAVNQQDMLSRVRVGVQFQPLSWLKFSAMGQDDRVPFYGLAAPNTMRDTMDLQEAYIELRGNSKTGFGAVFGRNMLNYGEARLIGSPQWSNPSRTYDNARLYYRTRKARFEILMVSPVKVLTDDFNKPELGERIWGTYDVFNIGHGANVDVYALRHSQNKIAGWTSAGTLGTDSYGGRFYGKLPYKFMYSLEGVGQTGHLGVLTQRAYAWFFGGSRKVALAGPMALNFSAEYKGASGTRLGSVNSGTFDQLSPANHDKFGHEDLFGWRNLKTFKSLETWNITRTLALNVMYDNHWLFSAADSLYNSSGSSISISKKGTAGTHVGQELDTFMTYTHGAHLVGAGFGHFFKGEFVTNTTPNINPRYFYVFQQYSFK